MARLLRTACSLSLLFVLLLGLTACLHTDVSSSESDTPAFFKLQPSEHPLDSKRFLAQSSAAPICPNGLSYFACENYAANTLHQKYSNIIYEISSTKVKTLVLRLSSGEMKVYRPEIDASSKQCQVCGYQVIMEYPEIQSLLIAKSMPEGRHYILLQLDSGAELELSQYPFFNEAFHYFAVLNSAMEFDAGINDIKLYQLDEDRSFKLILDGLTAQHPKHASRDISPTAVQHPRIVDVEPNSETELSTPIWNPAWGASQGVWVGPMQLVFTSLRTTKEDDSPELHYARLYKVVTASDQYWTIDSISEQTYLAALK